MPQHSCLQYRLRPITSYKKIPRYWAELARQMADHSIALYDFPDVFVHGVVKLWFSNKCFSDEGLPCASINMMASKGYQASQVYIILNEFLVSKETVVLRRWERSKQKFGFIKRVDKG